MTVHEPHVGDVYASNDRRDIATGNLQRRKVAAARVTHVYFEGTNRGIDRGVVGTNAQRGYRLVYCAQESQDDPAPERTYTRADMARAWEEGAEEAWRRSGEGWNSEYPAADALGKRTPFRPANDAPNPYEQEEA